jgi:uncharacterized OB-fold protein
MIAKLRMEKGAGLDGLEHPVISRDTAFFWAGLEAGELRIQRCTACATLRHPPRPVCAACGSRESDWMLSAGLGEVYSYSVVRHPPVPGRVMPHVVALVELDEGVRVLAPLLDVDPDDVAIGTRVQAVVVDEGDFVGLATRPLP